MDIPSDKIFGLVFSAFFLVIAFTPALLHHKDVRWLWLIFALAFLITTFSYAKILHPLNVLWAKFGFLLSKVTSPVILAVLFFGIITPMGIVLRLFHKTPLAIKFDKNRKSYWEAPRAGANKMDFRHRF